MLLEDIGGNVQHKLYCDLDGVLVDFCKGVLKLYPEFREGAEDKAQDRKMWIKISAHQKAGHEFWYECDPMSDAMVLWNYIKPYGVEILSATGNVAFGAAAQKHKWVAKHLGTDVVVNLTQKAVEKAKFATPTSILIDDKMKAIQPWIDAGGIGVLHTSAASTIAQLNKLGL